MASGRLEIEARGPFSLARSVAFAGGVAPSGSPQADADVLRLAFVDDGGEPVAIAVRRNGSVIVVDYASALPAERVAAHAARILSLDVDATEFSAVGERDPVIGRLQERHAGLRPVLFGSPFEAAVWAVLSQRTSMRQAAVVRTRLVEELGTPVEVDGTTLPAFPSPARLAGLEGLPGLPAVKVERLRGLARAALEGALDPEGLRRLEPDEALERLAQLPGIGPFSAQLILLRGAGHPDVLPLQAPRLASSVREAYGLDADPGPGELAELAEAWRPFRSWVVFLLRQ